MTSSPMDVEVTIERNKCIKRPFDGIQEREVAIEFAKFVSKACPFRDMDYIPQGKHGFAQLVGHL